MKKIWVLLVTIASTGLFAQVDTIEYSYDSYDLASYSKGKYMGVYRINFSRNAVWIEGDGEKEFVADTIIYSDTIDWISANYKYISIDHCKKCHSGEVSFYDFNNHIIQTENKKYGIIDSNLQLIVPVMYDEIYESGDYFKYTLREKNCWGFILNDGTIIKPQYGLPLKGWNGEKIKSIASFLDGWLTYLYYEDIYVKGEKKHALVMTKNKKPVYIDPASGKEIIPDKIE